MTDEQTAVFLALLERQAAAQERLGDLVTLAINILRAVEQKQEDANAWRR